LHKSHSDIVVLNAGAHFHDLGDITSMWSVLPQQIVDFQKSCQSKGIREPMFIWRTNAPGHYGCDNITIPHQNFALVPMDVDQFQWNLLPTFDVLSVQHATTLGMQIIDLSPLYMRGDGHPRGKVPLLEHSRYSKILKIVMH
jgi:hypothetical protein